MTRTVIPFSAYFEYITRLGGKTRSEQADRWLIQTYTDIDPSADFWANTEFMGQINGKNSGLDVTMPLTYDGFTFCRAQNVPGNFYWHFQVELQEDLGRAMKLAVCTCYLGKPAIAQDFGPIQAIADQLTFHHAEVLVKNFTAAVSPSRPPI